MGRRLRRRCRALLPHLQSVLQAEKFDPAGTYVRRWIPELRDMPDEWIHQPWKAPSPPDSYPSPIVGHDQARRRALAALAQLKKPLP